MSFYQYIGDLNESGNRRVFVDCTEYFEYEVLYRRSHIKPLTPEEMEELLKRVKGFQRQAGISIVTKYVNKDDPEKHVWVWDEEHRDSYPYYTPFGKLIEHIEKGDIIQPEFQLFVNDTRVHNEGGKFVLSSLTGEPNMAAALRVIREYFKSV